MKPTAWLIILAICTGIAFDTVLVAIGFGVAKAAPAIVALFGVVR